MTAGLEEGEWSAAHPGRTLHPGKNRYPFYRRLGGPQGRSGRAENLVPTGTGPGTVQPVVIRYTDWATRSTNSWYTYPKSSLSYHCSLLRNCQRLLPSDYLLLIAPVAYLFFFWAPRASNLSGFLQQKLGTLKKSWLFIEFPVTCPKHFKIAEHMKSHFFVRSIHLAAHIGVPLTLPQVAEAPLPLVPPAIPLNIPTLLFVYSVLLNLLVLRLQNLSHFYLSCLATYCSPFMCHRSIYAAINK